MTELRRWADKVLVGGNQIVAIAPIGLQGVVDAARALEEFKAKNERAVQEINRFAKAYRRGYSMPAKPNDRRTVRIVGKAKHWYADSAGQLHLADGESPWT